MRRLLTVTMALGLVISAMNFTGIFAIFTDRATTGTNSAESGTQPKAADLQLAVVDDWSQCSGATYADDLATGIIDVTDLQPDYNVPQIVYLCLKNVGTSPLGVTVSAIDVVETETGCTGDEALSGDLTCGTPNIGDGELGTVMNGQVLRFSCDGQDQLEGAVVPIESLASTPASLGTLPAPGIMCLRVGVTIPGVGGDLTSEMVQRAQSDKVEWRFAFDGSAS